MPLSARFWGARGSIPSPGPATARYGGNTPCVELRAPSGAQLILDAGTGLRRLGREMVGTRSDAPLDVTLLVTHTHWDHIQGLPFFLLQFRDGDAVRIFGPGQPPLSLETIVSRQMEPSVFPVPLSAIHARMTVTEITGSDFELAGFSVLAVRACHPGTTYGYSVACPDDRQRFTYLTDNELGVWESRGIREDLVRFLRQTNTLVHDAMYLDAELRERQGWGHSSAREAVLLALDAGCRRVVLFHHDPDHDDDALERVLEEALETRDRQGGDLEIQLATEGATLTC